MKRLLPISALFLLILGLEAIAQVAASPSPLASSPATAVVATGFIAWIEANSTLIFAIALGISETLALIPSIQSNSIFQAIFNVIQSLAKKPQA